MEAWQGDSQPHTAYTMKPSRHRNCSLHALWRPCVLLLLATVNAPCCSGQVQGGAMDQVKIVNTPAELISAVNGEGARHIVIQSHMNIPETGDVRHAVLQLKLSTKSIQGDCLEPTDTKYKRGSRQCVLRVTHSFLETPDATELLLANLYITAESPTAEKAERSSSFMQHMRVRKSHVWMKSVTLEGADDVLVEGVHVLGSTSMPGLIFAEGCVFRSLWGSSGAAWSLEAKRSRNDQAPASVAFVRCIFEDNQALIKGAGIHMDTQSILMLSKCIFRGNEAPKGPNIAAEEPSPVVYADPLINIDITGPRQRGFGDDDEDDEDDSAVVQSLPLAQVPRGLFLAADDVAVVQIEKEVAQSYTPLPLPAAIALQVRELADDPEPATVPGQGPSADDKLPASSTPPGDPSSSNTTSDLASAEQQQAQSDVVTGEDAAGTLQETKTIQNGTAGLRNVMVAVLCGMVALAVVMVAVLLLMMRRHAAQTREIERQDVTEAKADDGLPATDIVHVEAEVEDDEYMPAGTAADEHTDTIEPAEQEIATFTDNPVFVQNVWEMPPSRGFYLEDIMEERTVDLQPSGLVAPSGLIAHSSHDNLHQIVGDSLSPSKKLLGAEQFARRASVSATLHESLQSSTEHSLHDSLSDV